MNSNFDRLNRTKSKLLRGHEFVERKEKVASTSASSQTASYASYAARKIGT